MKKLNYFLLGAAGLLLASCSNDDLVAPAAPGDGNVNITVTLPNELASRAVDEFGLGTVASTLHYSVFDVTNGSKFVFNGTTTFGSSLETTVSLNLANGKTYQVAFFAQSPASMESATGAGDAVYTYDPEEATISVNYNKMNSVNNLNDAYDCFAGKTANIKVGTSSSTLSCTLFRPVAQINWGTDEIKLGAAAEAAEVFNEYTAIADTFGDEGQNIVTYLTVENAYSQYSILAGDVTGDPSQVTLSGFAAPYEVTFPVDKTNDTDLYTYVAVGYVLAPQASNIYDLTLTITDQGNAGITNITNDVAVSQAPVQANYQTNIFGSLLSDNVTITVVKSPGFAGVYNQLQGIQEVTPDNNTYTITNQPELLWVAQQVNSGANNFAGKTVMLANDIYLDTEWAPIGDTFAHSFSGTFNGNNKTIYNVVADANEASGFFGFVVGSISNLNISNATITGNHWGGVVAGYIYGSVTGCNVSNSTVTLSCEYTGTKWDNGDKAGAIVGWLGEGNHTLSGNTAENCTIQAYRDLGGIVGYVKEGNTVENNTATNITLNVNQMQNPEGYTSNEQYDAGYIVGHAEQNATIGTNSSSDITINYIYVATSSQDLATAIDEAAEGTTIYASGTVQLPSTLSDKEITIKGYGADQTIIDAYNAYWTYQGCSINLEDMTLKSFINSTNHTSMGFKNATAQTFTNVTFNGEFHVFSGTATFTNCNFVYDSQTGTNYQLWCQSDETTNINNCTMTCNDAKAILVVGASANSTGGDINIDGLTVTNNTANSKAVVEIHSENYTQAGTINIDNVTYPATFQKGLWQEIYNTGTLEGQETTYYKIVVNNETEQEGGSKGTYVGDGEYSE